MNLKEKWNMYMNSNPSNKEFITNIVLGSFLAVIGILLIVYNYVGGLFMLTIVLAGSLCILSLHMHIMTIRMKRYDKKNELTEDEKKEQLLKRQEEYLSYRINKYTKESYMWQPISHGWSVLTTEFGNRVLSHRDERLRCLSNIEYYQELLEKVKSGTPVVIDDQCTPDYGCLAIFAVVVIGHIIYFVFF